MIKQIIDIVELQQHTKRVKEEKFDNGNRECICCNYVSPYYALKDNKYCGFVCKENDENKTWLELLRETHSEKISDTSAVVLEDLTTEEMDLYRQFGIYKAENCSDDGNETEKIIGFLQRMKSWYWKAPTNYYSDEKQRQMMLETYEIRTEAYIEKLEVLEQNFFVRQDKKWDRFFSTEHTRKQTEKFETEMERQEEVFADGQLRKLEGFNI